eukprot:jgi/Botrbrau1/12048/Bobra.0295s0004.1
MLHVYRRVFLGGAGGYGKSYFMTKHILSALLMMHSRKEVGITAMTNDAAASIGGCTLHSWMGIGLGNGTADALVAGMSRAAKARLVRAKVLVVEEAAMLEADLADRIDAVLRIVRKSDHVCVWGGGGVEDVVVW